LEKLLVKLQAEHTLNKHKWLYLGRVSRNVTVTKTMVLKASYV